MVFSPPSLYNTLSLQYHYDIFIPFNFPLFIFFLSLPHSYLHITVSGTYDIAYDNGEKEYGVATSLITPIRPSQAPPSTDQTFSPASSRYAIYLPRPVMVLFLLLSYDLLFL